jgi:hypothetical protein
MQDSTVSPDTLGNQPIRRYRLGIGGLIVFGVWIAWAVRSYQRYDGLHLEHLVRDMAWGALVAVYLAVALAFTTGRYDKVGVPGEAVWWKWGRAALCLTIFAAVGWLMYMLVWFIMFARAMSGWINSSS